MALGRLFKSQVLTGPGAYYCPDGTQFNRSSNPWPPGEDTDLITRSDYSTRPAANWPGAEFPTNPATLDKLGQKVVIADQVSRPDYIANRHKTGVNAARMDGSAQWVPYEFIQRPLESHSSGGFRVGNNGPQQDVWNNMDDQ